MDEHDVNHCACTQHHNGMEQEQAALPGPGRYTVCASYRRLLCASSNPQFAVPVASHFTLTMFPGGSGFGGFTIRTSGLLCHSRTRSLINPGSDDRKREYAARRSSRFMNPIISCGTG